MFKLGPVVVKVRVRRRHRRIDRQDKDEHRRAYLRSYCKNFPVRARTPCLPKGDTNLYFGCGTRRDGRLE